MEAFAHLTSVHVRNVDSKSAIQHDRSLERFIAPPLEAQAAHQLVSFYSRVILTRSARCEKTIDLPQTP